MTGLKVPGSEVPEGCRLSHGCPLCHPLSHSIWNKNSLGVSLTHLEITWKGQACHSYRVPKVPGIQVTMTWGRLPEGMSGSPLCRKRASWPRAWRSWGWKVLREHPAQGPHQPESEYRHWHT